MIAPPDDHDTIAESLIALGGSAVQVAGDALVSYFPATPDPEEFAAGARLRIEDDLGTAAIASPLRVSWRWEADQDWAHVWRRGLRPRRVGPFVVTPSWCLAEAEADGYVIVVDPEMAFGTGEHATTRGALRLLPDVLTTADRVLDVGTGSGILAIGAAMLGAREVLAVESDGDAIENATDNLCRNGVADRVQLVHALVDPAFLQSEGPGAFRLILANVLSGILRPLLPAFREALVPGGHLVLGGILQEESEGMILSAAEAGFRLLIEDVEDEWWGAAFIRDDGSQPAPLHPRTGSA